MPAEHSEKFIEIPSRGSNARILRQPFYALSHFDLMGGVRAVVTHKLAEAYENIAGVLRLRPEVFAKIVAGGAVDDFNLPAHIPVFKDSKRPYFYRLIDGFELQPDSKHSPLHSSVDKRFREVRRRIYRGEYWVDGLHLGLPAEQCDEELLEQADIESFVHYLKSSRDLAHMPVVS